MTEQTKTITIDNTTYDLDTLSDNAKRTLDHLIAIENNINTKQFELEELYGAHEYFISRFREDVKE